MMVLQKSHQKTTAQYLNALIGAISTIDTAAIDAAGQLLQEVLRLGGIVYTLGNGGSASTAEHFCCDLSKPYSAKDCTGLRSVCLNGNLPLVTALTNDFGVNEAYEQFLKGHLGPNDALVLFSVHGGGEEMSSPARSQNLIRAIRVAQRLKSRTIGVSGFDGGLFVQECDVCIVVRSQSTPVVESLHLAIAHQLAALVREF